MRRSRFPGFRFRPPAIGLVLALAIMASLCIPAAQAAAPATGSIERVSVSSSGVERNQLPTGSTTSCSTSFLANKCAKRTISDDGSKVVFVSRAPNIVDGDNNNKADVFLATIDTAARTVLSVERVSVGPGGIEADGDSETPSISPNGNWIAFESAATNLTPGANAIPGITDIFVYDVVNKRLFLASVSDTGKPAEGQNFQPSVADDGSVAWTSYAHQLTTNGANQFQNVFVRIDPAGPSPHTQIVSIGDGGVPATGGPSKEATIAGTAATGLRVAFTCGATNIGGPEAIADDDVCVRDITAGVTKRLTTGAKVLVPYISADGTQVVFGAEGLDPDTRKDIYKAAVNFGAGPPPSPVLVSACSCNGNQAFDRPAVAPSIARDGTVAFQSAARYDTVTSEQVWIAGGAHGAGLVSKDLLSGTGASANAVADLATISGDGNWVSFTTAADNLVADDFNGSDDVYVAHIVPNPDTVGHPGEKTADAIFRVSKGPGRPEASGFAAIPNSRPAISADGKIVAFESDSSNLVPGDTNGVSDIFVRDRNANTTTRISTGIGGVQANGASFKPVMSEDGNLIAFESVASNLVAGDTNNAEDVFLYNRQTGEIVRVSQGNFGESPQASSNPAISPNGKFVAFESKGVFSPLPVATAQVIYRYNVATHDIVMVSTQPPNKPTGQRKATSRPSTDPSVADDGSVAFLSLARSLTGTDETEPKNANDVFIARPSGDVVKVTVNNDGIASDGDSFDPVISADGTKVAYSSLSTNMPAANQDTNPDQDIFLTDMSSGNPHTVLVSRGLGASVTPSINHDGSLVAFASTAADLVPGDQNAVQDVFLANPANNGISRVSVRPNVDGGGEANNASYWPAVSADGLTVAFKSSADNLVDGDGNGAFDTFVRGLTELPQPCTVSCVPGGGGVMNGLGYRFVAADGGIFSFDQKFYGSAGGGKLNRPIVGMAATPSNQGYWLVASDGGIFSYGDAAFLGSTGNIKLNSPIVGMAATPSGKGYWFVAADGGVFAFGDATFKGSMGGKPLNRPIVAMASTKTGNGYWLVASDGGIFSFGDAEFYGSTGNIKLNKPIVGMDRSGSGKGYRFVASDGGIFSYGDAGFYGSAGNIHLNFPIVGMSKTRNGNGYWLVASDGGVFSYGDAQFFGSTGNIKLNSPIVGMAG